MSSTISPPLTDSAIRREFKRLADQWTRETRNISSPTRKALHPAYQRIIALGPAVVPLILERMKKQRGDWFWALGFLTNQDPVPDTALGDIGAMTRAWIDWGRKNGQIQDR